MNKQQWFENFERVLAENPEMSDEQAAEEAQEMEIDQMADRADRLKDEKKHGDYGNG